MKSKNGASINIESPHPTGSSEEYKKDMMRKVRSIPNLQHLDKNMVNPISLGIDHYNSRFTTFKICPTEENNCASNLIPIQCLMETLNKTPKSQNIVQFVYDFEKDTCIGVISEFEKEFSLTPFEANYARQKLQQCSNKMIKYRHIQ